ncbi:MAG: MBL fold metallo-hydrolase, partial [Chitinophagaceae bacterium]
MKLYTINTGNFKLDGGAMFGVVPKSLWNKINPADEANLCTWAMRCLLVEIEGRLILIDNGIGNKQDAKFFGHYHLHGDASLEASLAQHGFHRDDITDVILTHLHFDHCGGSILREGDKLLPAFKNATYWSNEEHWEWAVNPNDREKASFLKENILPIQESGQLQFVDLPSVDWDAAKPLPEQSFAANISLRFVEGHTAGMMLPQITYKNKT